MDKLVLNVLFISGKFTIIEEMIGFGVGSSTSHQAFMFYSLNPLERRMVLIFLKIFLYCLKV